MPQQFGEQRRLGREVVVHRALGHAGPFGDVVHGRRREPPLGDEDKRALVEFLTKLVAHDVSVLLLGESGAGKDYFAEAIHACGPRRDRPLVRIDCAAIPHDLFESGLQTGH